MAFHPSYAKNRRFYVDYTDTNGDTRVVEFRSSGGVGVPGARQVAAVRPHRRSRTTTAASSSSGRTGCSTSAWATAAPAAIPQNHAQNLARRLGKLLRERRTSAGAKWEVAGYGLRNPWRFSFDRKTRRPLHRRRRPGHLGGDRLRTPAQQQALDNFGWRVYEGRSVRGRPAIEPPRPSRVPDRRLRPRRTAARSPAATSTAGRRCPLPGPLLLRRLLHGHGLEPARRAREAAERPQRAVPRRALSSFGEDAKRRALPHLARRARSTSSSG